MKKLFAFILFTVMVTVSAFTAQAQTKNINILIDTSMGQIEAELYADKAPITVTNFLEYVNSRFYDGLVFHRIIPGFMIQGGGMTSDMKEKETRNPIKIESDNGLKNTRGSLAMARTQIPDSATSQFFINIVDNPFLDFKAKTTAGYGYAVFGKVTKGMDVVDNIAKVQTGTRGFYEDVPLSPVIIRSIKVIK